MTRSLTYLSQFTLLLCLLCASSCEAQQAVAPPPPAHHLPLELVKNSLERYRQSAITTRRFKQEDLQPLLDALPAEFAVDTAGRSVEDRPLWRVRWGEGPTSVLLWSQMHGDEPTATGALFDFFAWIQGSGDGLDSLRTTLRTQLTLTFLPMLNPDGAARFDRRNALGIDLNRDALHLTSPEARLLKEERDRLDAEWGFNLHDQGIYYSAGFPGGKGCVISILAPAFDWEKTMSGKREDAAQLIALMNRLWQEEVPGQIGRYNDDFEPRAFGDNLQKWGTRTILIESGGYPGDPEKQEIRRLNLLGLIAGLYAIATDSYEAVPVEEYWGIPENESNGMHAVILENVTVQHPEGDFVMDVGLRNSDRTLGPENRQYTTSAYVSDLGDLHTFGAFERIDVAGKRVVPGKVYPGKLSSAEVSRLKPADLYAKGYTAVQTTTTLPADYPLAEKLRLLPPGNHLAEEVRYGASLDLLIYGDGGVLETAIINGNVVSLPN